MQIPEYHIIIADTQFLIIEGLKSVFANFGEISVTGTAQTQYELFKLLEEKPCNLLLTDLSVPDLDSVADLVRLKEKFPGVVILILLNSIGQLEFKEITGAGINHIILKSANKEEILDAVDFALKGKKYFSSDLMEMIIEAGETKSPVEVVGLTNAEIEIVRLIASGLTTKEIASRRNISFHTVNTHRKNIFRKLKVNNTSELIMLAIKAGWIDTIEYYI